MPAGRTTKESPRITAYLATSGSHTPLAVERRTAGSSKLGGRRRERPFTRSAKGRPGLSLIEHTEEVQERDVHVLGVRPARTPGPPSAARWVRTPGPDLAGDQETWHAHLFVEEGGQVIEASVLARTLLAVDRRRTSRTVSSQAGERAQIAEERGEGARSWKENVALRLVVVKLVGLPEGSVVVGRKRLQVRVDPVGTQWVLEKWRTAK